MQIRTLAAQVAALEADTWARVAMAAADGRRWQSHADAAVQASMDPDVSAETGASEPSPTVGLPPSMGLGTVTSMKSSAFCQSLAVMAPRNITVTRRFGASTQTP